MIHPEPLVTSPKLFTVTPLQASLAVGGVNDGEAVQFMVTSGPAVPIIGDPPTSGIVCETVAEWLPQASTAYQLLVMDVLQPFPEVISGRIAITVAPLHTSLAVGAVNDGVAVQSTVAAAPG